MRILSTGEPCAGELHARFGGRGESGRALLYPYRLQGRFEAYPWHWIPAPGGYIELAYNLTK